MKQSRSNLGSSAHHSRQRDDAVVPNFDSPNGLTEPRTVSISQALQAPSPLLPPLRHRIADNRTRLAAIPSESVVAGNSAFGNGVNLNTNHSRWQPLPSNYSMDSIEEEIN